MIHWQIKHERAEEFETFWKNLMNVEGKKGFHFEMLTRPTPKSDQIFNTWNITDPNYRTYINIGCWDSIEDFKKAVQETMPKASQATDLSGRTKDIIVLESFEYKVRERVVLTPIAQRGSFPNVSDPEYPPLELLARKMAG